MGQTFSISLSIASSFSFSLDTRKTTAEGAVSVKKRASPSRLRRNQRRKEEFLKRKTEPLSEDEAFKCEECGKSYKSENGLKIHKGKAHKKEIILPSPFRGLSSEFLFGTVSHKGHWQGGTSRAKGGGGGGKGDISFHTVPFQNIVSLA